MRVLVLLLALCGTGCHGALMEALEQRDAQSCIFWHGVFGHVVTSTGGVPIERCLADPCRGR